MEEPDSLIVDLSNATDVRASMKRAETILDAKREALRQREEEVMKLLREPKAEVAAWERKVAALETLVAAFAPWDSSVESQRQARRPSVVANPNSMQELVVGVVNREARPIQAVTVARLLADEGHDVDVVQVRNALYYAANTAKTILKLAEGRGIYAPLTYRENVIFDSAPSSPQRLSRDAVDVRSGEGTGEGSHPGGST